MNRNVDAVDARVTDLAGRLDKLMGSRKQFHRNNWELIYDREKIVQVA